MIFPSQCIPAGLGATHPFLATSAISSDVFTLYLLVIDVLLKMHMCLITLKYLQWSHDCVVSFMKTIFYVALNDKNISKFINIMVLAHLHQ